MVVTIKKIEKLTFRGVLLMYNELKVTYPRRGSSFTIPGRIGKCWFLRRWENRSNQKKASQSKVANQQKTQATIAKGVTPKRLSKINSAAEYFLTS